MLVDADGKIQGSIGLQRTDDPKTVNFTNISVSNELRGKSIGKTLVLFALNQSRILGFETVELATFGHHSDPDIRIMESARKLYEFLGFKKFKETVYPFGTWTKASTYWYRL